MPTDLELLDSTPSVETPDTPAPESTTDTGSSPFTASDAAPVPEATAVDAAPETPAPPAADGQETDELLDLPEAAIEDPLSVKALFAKQAQSPEFKALLDKDPGLRNLLFATARQAELTKQYKEIFQTPAVAKTALDLAQRHMGFSNTLAADPVKALDDLYAMTAPRDAQGNILFDEPNEAYGRLITGQREAFLWPHLTKLALDSKDEDLRDAVAIVAMKLGDKIDSPSPFAKPGARGAAAEKPALDPETQSRLTRLDELERANANTQAQAQNQYRDGVVTGITDSVNKAAGSYLDNLLKARPNVVMTDFIKQVVMEKSVNEIYQLAKDDVSYQNHVNFLYSSSHLKDKALQDKIVAEATKYARERLPKIIAKHIGEASKGVVASQQQRLTKQQDQQRRPEVQGTAGASTPSRQDPAERVKEFIAKNKRRPSDRELLDL